MPANKQQARPQPGDFGLSEADGGSELTVIFGNGNATLKAMAVIVIVFSEMVFGELCIASGNFDDSFELLVCIFVFAASLACPVVFRLWPLLERVEIFLRRSLDRTFGSQVKYLAALAAYDLEAVRLAPHHCPRCGSRDTAVQAVRDRTGAISGTAGPMARWYFMRICGMPDAVDRTEWFCHDCGWSAPHTPL